MKTKALALAMVILAMVFGSCTVRKDFSINVYKDFVINEEGTTMTSEQIIDLTKEGGSDFDKYKGDIESSAIEGAWLQVTNFYGAPEQELLNGTLKVSAKDGTGEQLFATLANLNLQSATAHETEISLVNAGKDRLASLLRNDPYTARLLLEGTVNQAPVHSTVKVHIRIKVTYAVSAI